MAEARQQGKMVTWQEFSVESVQTSVFTSEPTSFASGRAVAVILPKFRERFDGDMQALPLPVEVPPDIPRVGLQSSDGRWRLNMGPARIDSSWNHRPATPAPSLTDIARQCVEVLEHYVGETRVRVGRLALVVRRICPVEQPAQALIQRFCNATSQQEPFNRSETFEIHNHKVYRPDEPRIDFQINSWVRCKSASTAQDHRPVILVEQDLNTLAKEFAQRRFDADQIKDFFQMAVREADAILTKYFPKRD